MVEGIHWIIFMTKKMSKYARNMKLIIKEKTKKNDSARSRTGVHMVLALPQSLTPHRVLTTWGKIGPFKFSNSDNNQAQ